MLAERLIGLRELGPIPPSPKAGRRKKDLEHFRGGGGRLGNNTTGLQFVTHPSHNM